MAIITNLLPPPGEPIGASDPVSFDVIDPEVSELRVFVWAVFAGAANYELVHDGDNFTPTYSFSTITATPGGRTFTIQRVGGWPGAPDLRVDTCACPPTIADGDVPLSRTITAGAGLTGGGDLSADRTINIANGDGSITVNANDILVGTLQTDAQHGDLGGATLHALAVASGAAGFMSGTQAQQLADLVAAGAGVTDHGALTGLLDDDHTQYQLRSEQGAIGGYPTLNGSGHVVEPVTRIQETGGPTSLTVAAIPDGYLMQRSGGTVVGVDPTTLTGLDHGGLTGLGDDDHTQYLLADGSRNGATGGTQAFNNSVSVAGGVTATANVEAGTYVTATNYLEVLADSAPATPSSNDSRIWSDSSNGGRLHTMSDDGIARLLGQQTLLTFGFNDFDLIGTAARFSPTALPDAANIGLVDNDGVRVLAQMPLEYADGEDIVVDLLISTDSEDAGFTANFTIAFDRIVSGTSASDTRTLDTETSASQVVPSTSDEVLYTITTTIANANMDGIRPGDFFALEVRIDGAASGLVYLHKVVVRGAAP